MLSLREQEAGLSPSQDAQPGPQGPDETGEGRWRLRRRNPLRRKAALKALIIPAFFLSLLGCSLLIWALRSDAVAPVQDLRQQAAAALPVRAPEHANPVARAAPAPQPAAPAELTPSLPPPRPATLSAPAAPATMSAAEPLQANPLRPSAELSAAPAALALAPVRPAGGLTPTPNRDAVRDAQREAAALAASAAATSPTPAPTREAPRATVALPSKEREPATQTASIEKTGDSYMIILASVETEAEARAQLQQIHKKYSAALGAKKLGYTRVKSGNDYVWRVRSTGLSEDEAEEICEKIETAGGKCTARSN